MRLGEILRLKWTDIDLERSIITLNEPEKNSNPRIFKISSKLTGMIKALPKKSESLFKMKARGMEVLLCEQRKRIINKFQEPRLKLIRYHILRHWKATELYHQTKDPFFVKDFLGHKSILSTQIYIHLERIYYEEQKDQFHCKMAKTPEEAATLVEAGFDHVCEINEAHLFRKRK